MNKKQKILTGIILPIFLAAGVFGAATTVESQIAAAFTWWFAVGVVYAALFFLLGPTKR